MQTLKKVTQEVNQLQSAICNNCGGEIPVTFSEMQGLHVNYVGGYGSHPLEDMTKYHFDLCETCLSEMFKKFKHPPKIIDRLNYTSTVE